MISSGSFCEALREWGLDLATGVPCTYFGGPTEQLTRDGLYVAAADEGAALAAAAGVAAAGGRAAVMVQNSGLGNLVNPLTSLVLVYKLPVLIFVSLRGWPESAQDEPQHAVMGASTHALLDALGTWHRTLTRDADDLRPSLALAEEELDEGRPAAILVERGAIGAGAESAATDDRPELTRAEAVRCVARAVEGAPVVSTTGYISRELLAAGDADTNFYMQGSMGHAMAFGLGVALTRPDLDRVVVLDGDGAALMHLGSMSTIGALRPGNLIHVILDNGVYESTGGQQTNSATVDFARVARACGYASAVTCREVEEIAHELRRACSEPGPHLCVVETAPDRAAAPPRVSGELSAPAIARRFAAAVARDALPV